MENKMQELEKRIIELQNELDHEREVKGELVEKLDQCAKFAAGLKKQRDEAVELANKLLASVQKPQIILPGHVDQKGKPKIEI